jgi:MFS family permease
MSRKKHKALSLLAVGFLLGIVVWAFSPWLTGKVEPWDTDAPSWPLSWLLLAVLGGLVGHLRGVCLPLGYALGQMLITTPSVFIGEFGVLAWVFIGGYAAAAVAATLAVLGVTALLKRLWRKRSALPLEGRH